MEQLKPQYYVKYIFIMNQALNSEVEKLRT